MPLTPQEEEELHQLNLELGYLGDQIKIEDKKKQPTGKPASIDVTPAGSALSGAAQMASAGWADEAAAGLGAIGDVTSATLGQRGDISLQDAYKTRLGRIREYDKIAAEQNPASYFTGGVAGGVLAGAALSPMNPATYKGAAILGGVSGLGMSEKDISDIPGVSTDVALGIAGGAAGKYAGDKLGNLYKSLRQKSKDKAMDALFAQNQAGLNRLKLKKDGYNKVAEAITSSEYGRPIVSGLRKGSDFFEPTKQRFDEVSANISKAISDVDELNLASVDGKSVARKIMGLRINQIDDPNLKGIQNLLAESAEAFNKKGFITLGEAQELKNKVYKYSLKNPATTSLGQDATNKINQILAEEIRGSVESGSQLVGAGLEDVAKNLSKFKQHQEAITGLDDALKAASKKDTQEIANRSISPTDYITGLTVGGAGLAGGIAAQNPGLAFTLAALGIPAAMTHKFFRERSSTMASSALRHIANAMDDKGWSAKYMPILRAAASRGPSSLIILHNKLSSDPEYINVGGNP